MRHVLLLCLAVALVGGCKKKKAEEATAPTPASGTAAGTAEGTAAAPTPGSAAEPAGSGTAAAAPGSAAAPVAAAAYCGATPCPCKAGSEQKDGDKLKICELEKAATAGGVECQPGRILFHDDGSLAECLPTADTKVGDYTCKKAPLTVAWHKGGKLRSCSLAADATIDGVATAAGKGVDLHENGKLRMAWASAPVKVGDWMCSKQVRLFDDGKLEACTVTNAGKIGDQDIPANSTVRVTADGKLKGLELGAAGKVAGKAAKAGDRICFDDAGKPTTSQSCWMY